MAHDFDKQKSETMQVWDDLNARKELPSFIKLDLHFIPDTGAYWEFCKRAMQAAGFQVEFYEDGSTLEASIENIENTSQEIWCHEKRATIIALNHGFIADGWGFIS